MNIITLIILSFLAAFISIYAIIPVSLRHNIGIDHPGKRKLHETPVPRVGGVGIFLAMLMSLFFMSVNDKIISILIAGLIIFAVGLYDDIKGVHWPVKMIGVGLAATITIFHGDMTVRHIGTIFGYGNLNLGMWAIPFTYLCILGVVSAINLCDGLNGLVAGISLIIFIFLAIFSYMDARYNFMYISLAMSGGLAAFLIYNYPSGRIFMGDSGSHLIGFTIAIISIAVFQRSSPYQPMTPVVLLAIPIFDTIRVMMLRIIRGRNPFSADNLHIHHILVRAGLSKTKTVLSLWLLTLIFAVTAYIIRLQSGWEQGVFFMSSLGIIWIFLTILHDLEANKGEKTLEQTEAAPVAAGMTFNDSLTDGLLPKTRGIQRKLWQSLLKMIV